MPKCSIPYVFEYGIAMVQIDDHRLCEGEVP